MKHPKLEQLKHEYYTTPVPEELDTRIRKTIAGSNRRRGILRGMGISAASLVAACLVFTIALNTSPAFAQGLSDIPVVGSLARVFTFREYTLKNDNFEAKIQVPAITGLNNDLQSSLNEKYLKENEALYDAFMKEVGSLKGGEIHLGVYSSYKVVTNNSTIFSICRTTLKTAADSYTTLKYDTIDKQKQVLLTLPILFRDNSYLDVISAEIIRQMKEQMKDGEMIYWLNDPDIPANENFSKIAPNQSFYINPQGKLVISFNQFEVAPGYMGTPEFVIPTEILQPILVGNDYIK